MPAMNNSTGLNDSLGEQPFFGYVDMYQEPLALQVIHLALYGIIFLLAFLGNVLVIAVVFKTRELRTGKHRKTSVTSRVTSGCSEARDPVASENEFRVLKSTVLQIYRHKTPFFDNKIQFFDEQMIRVNQYLAKQLTRSYIPPVSQ